MNRKQRRAMKSISGPEAQQIQHQQHRQLLAAQFNEALEIRQVCEVMVEEVDKMISATPEDDEELDKLNALEQLRTDLKSRLNAARAQLIQAGMSYVMPPAPAKAADARIVAPSPVERADVEASKGQVELASS
jgi:hypothetical protein